MANKYADGGPLKTFGWQLAKAFCAALVVVIYSRGMGAFGRGNLSVMLLYLQLTLMVSELIAGGALANLFAKFSVRRIAPSAHVFLFAVLLLGYVVGWFLWVVPNQGVLPLNLDHPKVIALNLLFMQGFFLGGLGIQYNYLQAKGLVHQRNQLQLLIEILKLLGLALCFEAMYGFIFPRHFARELVGTGDVIPDGQTFNYVHGFNELAILWVLVYASGIAWVYSMWKIWRRVGRLNWRPLWNPPREMFESGVLSQVGHILLFLLYRLPLWWVASEYGGAEAGVLANALLMADTIWIFGNSFGTILHARVITGVLDDLKVGRMLSRYVWLSGMGTLVAILVALCVPVDCYVWVFGDTFSGLKASFMSISPAVFFLALSAPIGHYLHAQNRFVSLIVSYSSAVLVLALIWFCVDPFMWKLMGLNVAFFVLFLLNYLQVKHIVKTRGILFIVWRFTRIRFAKK